VNLCFGNFGRCATPDLVKSTGVANAGRTYSAIQNMGQAEIVARQAIAAWRANGSGNKRVAIAGSLEDLTQATHSPTIDGRFDQFQGQVSMSFDAVPIAPPDAILGLSEAFAVDKNPRKVNLSVGVYKDATGKTPIMRCVKEAEGRILQNETTKNYAPIEGSPQFAACVQEMIFGPGSPALAEGRTVTAQTPGGTAALRVAADFVKRVLPKATVWLSDPTWPNHPSIFQAAGLAVRTYPYFDVPTNGLAFEQMLSTISDIPDGDVLLLHGCCHNPTGIDPTAEQWTRIAESVARGKFLTLVDFAYQGLAEGIREDASGLAALVRTGQELLIASSFSKNFGVYNERVGALSAVCKTGAAAQAVLSQIKTCIRANYSNPPAHGAAIVTTILSDSQLRTMWDGEVRQLRERINGMRSLFVRALAERGVDRDFSFIARQRGMFSYSGLTPDQVRRLREEYSIYVVGSGRINVAGMTEENMVPLCSAIADVLR
jgi:aspartate/tyrosine/aromatic aminotransferase